MLQQFKALKIIHRFLVFTVSVLAFLLCFIMVVCTLDYFDFWNESSILFGTSFLSPLWLLLPVLLLSLVLFFLDRKKLSLITIIVYLIYFLLIGDVSFKSVFSNNKIDNGETQLSVLSLNVRYYSYGEDKVFNFIDSVNADIVLLSENTLSADSIIVLSALEEKYFIFTGKKYETAIFSKFPVIAYQEIELPTHQASLSGSNDIDTLINNPNRSFSHVKFCFNDEEVNAISVRLIAGRPKTNELKDQVEWGKYLVKKQTEEIETLVNYLKTLEGPIVFGGDLNAPPNAKIVKPLYNIAEDAAYVNNFFPSPTFRTEFPVIRLDYIFSLNGLKPVEYTKINVKVSDHFPVFAKLELR
ncbi:MAG: hypothetical protein CMF23_17530 [Ignavibacteriae bacterium]|jgi:endonuclease/exonuclease/phosphatase (EEP) superfamily protein YafD|nr:hypothetical protein [Ignavibacteriota bacterium]